MAEKSKSKKEYILIEIANSISHGIGVILGIIFFVDVNYSKCKKWRGFKDNCLFYIRCMLYIYVFNEHNLPCNSAQRSKKNS